MAKKVNDNAKSNETATNVNNEPKIVELTEEEKQSIRDEIEANKQKAKELRAKLNQKPLKEKKEAKGVMVTFKNKAGNQITGLGNQYYVVRQGGKLHYKEATAVHILTAEEVEALPKAEAEEVAA